MSGDDLMVKNAMGSWKQWVGQIDKTIGAFGDEELQREVAPGQFEKGKSKMENGAGGAGAAPVLFGEQWRVQ
jgi:hypothetical protein